MISVKVLIWFVALFTRTGGSGRDNCVGRATKAP